MWNYCDDSKKAIWNVNRNEIDIIDNPILYAKIVITIWLFQLQDIIT